MIRIEMILRFLSLLFAIGYAFAAPGAFALTIGLVAPQGGPYAVLGQQLRAGADAAVKQSGDTLTLIDEPCATGTGPAIADKLVAAKVDAAIGFLCSESLDGLLAKLGPAGIPALTLSVRWPTVMEDALKSQWPLFRLAPSTKAESEKLVEVIVSQWAGTAFALLDDGTIRSRELVEAIRVSLEQRGMKPVFTDTYRPAQEQQIALVRRLKKTGATNVFIGGDRSDVSIIARDAKAENIPLTLMGGEAMRAVDRPVPLQDGVLAVITPDYARMPSAQKAVDALRTQGSAADGYALPAFASVQFLHAAAALNEPSLAEAISKTKAETVIGSLSFTDGHELSDNPFQLQEWRDGGFQPPRPLSE
ncbi:ABC transporter substrate-binding protein [Agrobacterium vitis]|uniref:ABC transporter substrate-binding protein n=1 Tax=Agrobacterium vitis TaxID=373 RepID=A0AAE5AVJ4_AGRVI|nr:ABC transporter substrate-binding protein [Allorhizobium sp. Av2]MCM2439946.1 ABC transporter substrate-binding protein [Agrobacterium vitis]MUZ57157.1 ABC transporter substrate-binding protein [Agrobacterium vitis]MVA65466.1 ABC transporter substrate-binding protein [Agrobacterium vitis]MVA86491.1 ABC transporter substrate-binding protein [Agrobacterium vitis]